MNVKVLAVKSINPVFQKKLLTCPITPAFARATAG